MYKIFTVLKFICLTDARITLEMIENSYLQLVPSYRQIIRVNPTGPLNFLRGHSYIADKMICKRRLLSPEMYVKWNLEITDEDNMRFTAPEYQDDKLLDESIGLDKADLEYLNAYHRAFTLMFNVKDAGITISNDDDSSFYNFLNSEKVVPCRTKLFAALLLLSEGVQLPLLIDDIAVEGHDNIKMPFLYLDKNNQSEVLPLYYSKTSGEGVVLFEVCDKAKKVLSFFMDFGSVWQEEYCFKRQQESKYFMYSPNFILQAFIYEFVNDEETLKEIISYYHLLLAAEINKLENPSNKMTVKAGAIKKNCPKQLELYRRLHKEAFAAAVNVNKQNYMNVIKKIRDAAAIKQTFPFNKFYNPPLYRYVKKIRRIVKDDGTLDFKVATKNSDEYVNRCEIAIYSLLCTLRYNFSTRLYSLDELSSASKELKECFDKYNNPFAISYDKNFDDAWSKVVADLEDERINYLPLQPSNPSAFNNARNSLNPGWINTLLVITTICGLNNEKQKLCDLQNEITVGRQKYALYEEKFEPLVYEIFHDKLGINKNFTISFHNLEIDILREGEKTADIFGVIKLKFEMPDGLEKEVLLKIGPKYFEFECTTNTDDLFSEKLDELDELVSHYDKKIIIEKLIKNSLRLLANDLSAIVKKRAVIDKKLSKPKNIMEQLIGFNELLISAPIESTEDKKRLYEYVSTILQQRLKKETMKIADENEAKPFRRNESRQINIENLISEFGDISLNDEAHKTGNISLHNLPGEIILLIRFISNIMGAQPLRDHATRVNFLQYHSLYDKDCQLCPNITIKGTKSLAYCLKLTPRDDVFSMAVIYEKWSFLSDIIDSIIDVMLKEGEYDDINALFIVITKLEYDIKVIDKCLELIDSRLKEKKVISFAPNALFYAFFISCKLNCSQARKYIYSIIDFTKFLENVNEFRNAMKGAQLIFKLKHTYCMFAIFMTYEDEFVAMGGYEKFISMLWYCAVDAKSVREFTTLLLNRYKKISCDFVARNLKTLREFKSTSNFDILFYTDPVAYFKACWRLRKNFKEKIYTKGYIMDYDEDKNLVKKYISD